MISSSTTVPPPNPVTFLRIKRKRNKANMKPNIAPSVIPTTAPGAGESLRLAYVVGMTSICC